jgi:hypothetical protein
MLAQVLATTETFRPVALDREENTTLAINAMVSTLTINIDLLRYESGLMLSAKDIKSFMSPEWFSDAAIDAVVHAVI